MVFEILLESTSGHCDSLKDIMRTFCLLDLQVRSYLFGSKVTSTGYGKRLLMTNKDEVYSFHCLSANECGWSKEAYELKIDRIDHVFLTVPPSLVENCTSGK